MSKHWILSLASAMAGFTLVPARAGTMLIEAEGAVSLEPPFVRVEAANPPPGLMPVPDASRGAYLAVPQGAGNPPDVTGGKAVFEINIPQDGLYTLWLRAYWDDSCGNSVSVQINDRPVFMIEDSTYKTWHWVRSPPRLVQLQLPAGPATLTLHNREDGARIDQILLTTDRRHVPVGIEEP
jgi:hypothetical protein